MNWLRKPARKPARRARCYVRETNESINIVRNLLVWIWWKATFLLAKNKERSTLPLAKWMWDLQCYGFVNSKFFLPFWQSKLMMHDRMISIIWIRGKHWSPEIRLCCRYSPQSQWLTTSHHSHCMSIMIQLRGGTVLESGSRIRPKLQPPSATTGLSP